MNLENILQRVSALVSEWALHPLERFLDGLSKGERSVLYVLLAASAAAGFALGRHRSPRVRRKRNVSAGEGRMFGAWRFPTFQNRGEAQVSRVLLSQFGAPDYHLMNHVTLRMQDGTTQVDHILVSKFGVFVIETKHYSGWIFGNGHDAMWTQVIFRQKFKFQNPIIQNYRHVRAVQSLLEFLPPAAIRSLVVFSGTAEFKTEPPQGVVSIDQLSEYVRNQTEQVMSLNRLQFCVGRLETSRLAISAKTDVEHVQSLARRLGDE